MNIVNHLFFVFFAIVAVSYGWGMRGTIIGGEKGAMLPGAFMGLLMAVFSGSEVLASSPWILAGAGAVGMYCGGNMTYGETLHLSMHEANSPTLKKGLIALFVKGGIWFGIFGGFVSLYISAVAGYYELWQIILFFCLLPVFAFAFYFIFNNPHNPAENKFPKIYFSIKRKESWGGLFGILTEIIVFSVIFKDWSVLAMSGGAFLSGAVGWVIAQIMQIRAKHPGKNSKRLFEKLHQKNAVEAWKLMECVLGAIGGMGCAVTFILTKPLFAEKLNAIDENGYHTIITESKVTYILFIIYLIILAVDCVQYFIVPNDSVSYKKYMKFCNMTEFAIYSIIPFIFMMLGALKVATVVSVPVVLLVLVQEFAEKYNKVGKPKAFFKTYSLALTFIYLIYSVTYEKYVDIFPAILVYTMLYEAGFFFMKKTETGKVKLSNGEKTVHVYFTICCVLIMIMSIFIK